MFRKTIYALSALAALAMSVGAGWKPSAGFSLLQFLGS